MTERRYELAQLLAARQRYLELQRSVQRLLARCPQGLRTRPFFATRPR